MDFLKEYYESRDEDSRLTSRHGSVEYITSMKYIHEFAKKCGAKRIFDVGAGTGRYSVALAREGFEVTAVELLEHNLEILKGKLCGSEKLAAYQGNALDLSRFSDGEFDMTLVFGPMYHLYTDDDRRRALAEAVRVTRRGGFVLVAYCMNEPTVVSFVFGRGALDSVLENNMLTEDWHCISEPKDVFAMLRTEEIDALDGSVDAVREKIVATDGATNYMRETVDAMDDRTFEKWVEYHLATCERADLLGASHHTLDILKVGKDG